MLWFSYSFTSFNTHLYVHFSIQQSVCDCICCKALTCFSAVQIRVHNVWHSQRRSHAVSIVHLLPRCLFAVVIYWCFMIGMNVWWVYLASQNIPCAAVLRLGNRVVKLKLCFIATRFGMFLHTERSAKQLKLLGSVTAQKIPHALKTCLLEVSIAYRKQRFGCKKFFTSRWWNTTSTQLQPRGILCTL